MNSSPLARQSLKTRVTLLTLVIFAIGVWSLAFYASQMLREDMQRLLGDQQFSTVSFMATEIDHELIDRLAALETMARGVSSATLGDTAVLQVLLEQRPILQSLFNAGVIFYRRDATAILEFPRSTGRVGDKFADSEHLLSTLKEGKSAIGAPHYSRNHQFPEFVMTVPIRDAQSNVIGALAGLTNLSKPNFFDRIAQLGYGRTGGYMLVAPQSRLVVSATERSRIMEALPAPGMNSLIDRFVQGYEGSAIAVNARGVEVLASAKGVPRASWYVAAFLPTEEAFVPIHAMQQRMLVATFFVTLLMGALIWWILKRQLAPMVDAAKALAALSDADQPAQPLSISSQDEIGDLIAGFNRLLKTLGQREEALKETQSRTQLLLETALDAVICIGEDGKVLTWNSHARVLFGYSEEMALGRDISDLIIPPAYRQQHRLGMARFIEGGAGRVVGKRMEWSGMRADGTELPIEVRTGALRENGKFIFTAHLHDISERKQAEIDWEHSSSRYQGILHNMLDAYWRVDKDGRIVEANQAIGEMHGYSVDELRWKISARTPTRLPAKPKRSARRFSPRSIYLTRSPVTNTTVPQASAPPCSRITNTLSRSF